MNSDDDIGNSITNPRLDQTQKEVTTMTYSIPFVFWADLVPEFGSEIGALSLLDIIMLF